MAATLSVRRTGASPAHRAARRPARRAAAPGTPRRALVHFALATAAAVLLIAVGGASVSRAAARSEALMDARRINGVIAKTVIEPNLQDGLLTGDPAAYEAMGVAAERVGAGRPVLRMKLWTPDGRIVYSDDPRLVGRVYPLLPDEAEALATGESDADITDLSRAENDLERNLGTLVEVYRPVSTPSGQQLLFETYLPVSTLAERTTDVWWQFLPITLGALVLLQLVQFPLAVRLARQTDRARRDRERMLHRALAASDAERRRIAADLHDGVVQDLAATSIALAGAAVSADRHGRADESGRLHLAADAVRAAIRSLRSLLVDIHPPNLRRTGLAVALGDLAASTSARSVPVTLVVDDGATAGLGERAEQFAFRVAQEALRNAVTHAGATAVEVRVGRRRPTPAERETHDCDVLVLRVTDDGRGFDPGVPAAEDDRPHMGLRLLDDLAGDVDGRVEVISAPGRGTTVQVEVPVR